MLYPCIYDLSVKQISFQFNFVRPRILSLNAPGYYVRLRNCTLLLTRVACFYKPENHLGTFEYKKAHRSEIFIRTRGTKMKAVASSKFALSICSLATIESGLPAHTSHIISLIDPGTRLPRSLQRVKSHQRLVVQLHDLLDPANGKIVPEIAHVEALCEFASSISRENLTHLVVHCHMGRSRSAAAAAIVLIALGCPSPSEAFDQITAVRDPVWPNQTLIELGDEVLGCAGALISARDELCKGVLMRHPEWVRDPDEANISH